MSAVKVWDGRNDWWCGGSRVLTDQIFDSTALSWNYRGVHMMSLVNTTSHLARFVVSYTRCRQARLADVGLPEVLVAGALVVNLFVVFWATHFPYQDAPNHLARYVLIEKILSGGSVPGIEFRWVPSSYLGLDLLGVACVWLFAAPATLKIFAALAAILPTVGMYLLLRATAPMRRGWAVLGALMTLSWFLLAGLLNYVIGFGLALCYIALWWPRRASPSWAFSFGMAALIAPLFLVHLSAPLIVLGLLGVNFGVLLLTGSGSAFRYINEPSFRLPALCTLVFACMWWWIAGSGEVGFDSSTPTVFRSTTSKIAAIGAPFYSFSLIQAAFMGASYLVMLLIFVFLYGRKIWKDPFFLASLMFFFLFLAFPKDVGGAGGTDVRWLLPAYILPFCCAGAPRRHVLHGPFLLAFAFSLFVVNTAVIFSWTITIDRALDDFDAALRELPTGSRVLPLIFMKGEFPRVTPYDQYASWHIIRAQGAVPGLWSLIASRDGQAPLPHMQHFVVSRRYFPEVPGELDWRRISGEYDFIIVAATVEQTRMQIGALAPQIARVGRISVHKVLKLQSP
jgi:hypothetical protein